MKKTLALSLISLFVISAILVSCGGKKDKVKNRTIKILKESVYSEKNTSIKYDSCAAKAERDGFLQIAKLFRAIAKSEEIHSKNFLKALDSLGVKFDTTYNVNPDIKSTKENLEAAVNGESNEIDSLYPKFIKISKKANINIAQKAFEQALGCELQHKEFYNSILNILKKQLPSNTPEGYKTAEIEVKIPQSNYFICAEDGCFFTDSTVKNVNQCGMCNSLKEKFIIFGDKK